MALRQKEALNLRDVSKQSWSSGATNTESIVAMGWMRVRTSLVASSKLPKRRGGQYKMI